MNDSFVADASVAVGWVHPAQATRESDAMYDSLRDGAILEVPAIWPLEVANALAVLVRRRKMNRPEHLSALGWLQQMPAQIDHEGVTLAYTILSELAAKFDLSIYDAAYLELAQRRGLALGCKDEPLRQAAKRAGVRLWR